MENTQDLPMNWWKFCKYFRFPVNIATWIISLLTICNNVIDGDFYYMDIVAILIPTIYIIFQFIVYSNFIKETKNSYKLLISSFFIELIINSVLYAYSNSTDFNFTQSFMLYSVIWGFIFVYPNCVYFSKRKYVFEQKSTISSRQHKNALLDNNVTKGTEKNTQQSQNTSWQEYLDNNFKTKGKATATSLSDIRFENNTDTIKSDLTNNNCKDKFCRNCGSPLLETDNFCAICGKKIN